MRHLDLINNPYRDDKVYANSAIFGMMDTAGRPVSGEPVVRAITNMHVRSNGLGGGFAIYGLYPKHKNDFAFHVMYESEKGRQETESYLSDRFDIVEEEDIPTEPLDKIRDPPILRRYFIRPAKTDGESFEDIVAAEVTWINTNIEDSFIFSAAKDMGVFKGVGYPEDLARFYRLQDYEGYMWLAHGRFPTNTQAWWGGAHPFSMLDWTVIHNGEISSYGTNRRFVEDYGYRCNFFTDTEVIAYAVDLLMRRQGFPIELAAKILAPPLWEKIERMDPASKKLYSSLRATYGGLLLNGPFAVIVGRTGEMIGLTDRIRLRPLTAGTSGNLLFLSSEEAAIRLVCDSLDRVWTPDGGVPIVGRVGEGLIYREEN